MYVRDSFQIYEGFTTTICSITMNTKPSFVHDSTKNQLQSEMTYIRTRKLLSGIFLISECVTQLNNNAFSNH